MFSTDPLFDNFAVSIGLGLGGQSGEILATCAGIADGDDSGWHDAWSATADRLTAVQTTRSTVTRCLTPTERTWTPSTESREERAPDCPALADARAKHRAATALRPG